MLPYCEVYGHKAKCRLVVGDQDGVRNGNSAQNSRHHCTNICLIIGCKCAKHLGLNKTRKIRGKNTNI